VQVGIEEDRLAAEDVRIYASRYVASGVSPLAAGLRLGRGHGSRRGGLLAFEQGLGAREMRNAVKHTPAGGGLGLPISRDLVRGMGDD
jgi:hypothetical protein